MPSREKVLSKAAVAPSSWGFLCYKKSFYTNEVSYGIFSVSAKPRDAGVIAQTRLYGHRTYRRT